MLHLLLVNGVTPCGHVLSSLAMSAAGDYPVCLIKQHRARFAGHTVGRILRGPRNGDAFRGPSPSVLVDEQPLRAELLSVSQLEQHAKSLAALHEVESRSTGPD